MVKINISGSLRPKPVQIRRTRRLADGVLDEARMIQFR